MTEKCDYPGCQKKPCYLSESGIKTCSDHQPLREFIEKVTSAALVHAQSAAESDCHV